MPIKVELENNKFKVRILSSPNFARDRDLLAKVTGRKAVYNTKTDEFLHWELPKESLSHLYNTWGEALIGDSPTRSLISKLKTKLTPIEDLESTPITIKSCDGKTLLDFQEKVVGINESKDVLLLSFATGTGKTFTSIMRLANIGFKKLLIIGPKKLRFNWRTEVREALGKEMFIFWGANKAKRDKLAKEVGNHEIIYVTYETAAEFFSLNIPVDHVVIDEVHIVCNPKTIQHKSINKILRERCSGHIIGASATPMRLRIDDLWGVLNLLDPDFAGPKSIFLDQFQEVLATMPVQKNGKTFHIPIKVTTKNEDKLREKLKAIMIRVKKDQVVDFKDSIEIIDVELTNRQRDSYSQAVETLRIELSEGSLDLTNPLTKMLRLLEISEGMFNIDDRHSDSGKLDFLQEELKERMAAGEKVIVWSRFETITRKIQAMFPAETVVYSGKVTDAAKNLAVWAFQGVTNETDRAEFSRLRKFHPNFLHEPGTARIFTGTHSLKSGMGVNLHSAAITYFTSYDWNPNAIFQARDRVSRLGQTRDTETFFLVSENTIERKALRLILDHYYRSVNVLDGSGDIDSKLTRALINLLND
jgi:SNF2 family DNA or RNA helicase